MGKHDLDPRKKLQMSAKAARRTSYPLGDGSSFSKIFSVERNDAIRLAEVVTAQNDSIGTNQTGDGQRSLLIVLVVQILYANRGCTSNSVRTRSASTLS
jgi:hypothetical protein